jgi:hypothetical protein
MENQDPIKFLTRVQLRLINSQPSELSQVSVANNEAIDIIIICKQLIRCEVELARIRRSAATIYEDLIEENEAK